MRGDLELDLLGARGPGLGQILERDGELRAGHGELLHGRGHCLAERLGGRLALGAQLLRVAIEHFARRRHFAAQRFWIRRQLELLELALEIREARRQLLGPYPMLAPRGVQRLDARLDLTQRFRVEVDALGVVPQRARRFARLRLRRLEHLDDRHQRRVVRRERAQPARHRAELRERGAFGIGQRLERGLGTAKQARAVLQARVPRRYFGPLAFARREALELQHQVLDLGALRFMLREVLLRLVGDGFEL